MTEHRFCLKYNGNADIPTPIDLWPEGIPDFDKIGDPDMVKEWVNDLSDGTSDYYFRFVNNPSVPALYPFPAPKGINTGKCVIVCPGGGYLGVSIDSEGFDIARMLNSIGVSAFVLKYRLPSPNDQKGLLPDAPRQDAGRAIRYIRAHAEQYGIDPGKVGIMGFSSGGHVAVTASTLYGKLPVDGVYPGISARPDFTILIYPVVSLYEGYCHTGSRDNMCGAGADWTSSVKFYSGERQVSDDTPPVFMALTEDDPIHPYNSINYYIACLEHHVPAELHIYPKGGHGYGLAVQGLGIDEWPDRLISWLKRL